MGSRLAAPLCTNDTFDSNLKINNSTYNQCNPKSPSSISVAVINCQSLVARKATFAVFIDHCKPDFIAGNESWLSPSIINQEVFP